MTLMGAWHLARVKAGHYDTFSCAPQWTQGLLPSWIVMCSLALTLTERELSLHPTNRIFFNNTLAPSPTLQSKRGHPAAPQHWSCSTALSDSKAPPGPALHLEQGGAAVCCHPCPSCRSQPEAGRETHFWQFCSNSGACSCTHETELTWMPIFCAE